VIPIGKITMMGNDIWLVAEPPTYYWLVNIPGEYMVNINGYYYMVNDG
jgi:hypothetical protein